MPMSTTPHKDLKTLAEETGYPTIGQRIRRLRARADLTIRELTEAAEVSKNTVLRIEQGFPTHIGTIRQIARALKQVPEDLAGPNFSQPLIAAVHRNSDDSWHDMVTYQWMSHDRALTQEERDKARTSPRLIPFNILKSCFKDGLMTPHMIEVCNPSPMRTHSGTEFCFVVSGSVRFEIDGSVYDLEEGESIYFWAGEPHRYEPLGDKFPPKILSIVVNQFAGKKGKEQ